MKFFSYGIFLDGNLPVDKQRTQAWNRGQQQGKYATVKGYKTVGSYIVMAVKDPEATLTGLVFNISNDQLQQLDRIEAGYERVNVTTVQGDDVVMYVKPQDFNK